MLREAERQRIDAAFARMAQDPEYHAELLQIEQEFSPASDATWRQLDLAEQRPPASPGDRPPAPRVPPRPGDD